jgi:hypothetical protein
MSGDTQSTECEACPTTPLEAQSQSEALPTDPVVDPSSEATVSEMVPYLTCVQEFFHGWLQVQLLNAADELQDWLRDEGETRPPEWYLRCPEDVTPANLLTLALMAEAVGGGIMGGRVLPVHSVPLDPYSDIPWHCTGDDASSGGPSTCPPTSPAEEEEANDIEPVSAAVAAEIANFIGGGEEDAAEPPAEEPFRARSPTRSEPEPEASPFPL